MFMQVAEGELNGCGSVRKKLSVNNIFVYLTNGGGKTQKICLTLQPISNK